MAKIVTMTAGPIRRKMITFAVPIMLGNLFQQLYNTADSMIVGNFLGHHALAAVTASASLSLMMIGFMMGLSTGAGVIISRYYGARDQQNLTKAINTTIVFGLMLSSLMTVLGVVFTEDILGWMGTPDSVADQAAIYLRIFFCGSVGIGMYNVFVGIMQAVGDNKHPLYYLIFSSVLNVVLNLAFVTATDLGVAGAAIATIVSQFASPFCCLYRLCRIQECYQVCLSKIQLNRSMLKQVVKLSIPSGLQNSIISFGNVIVQSYVNGFGDLAMAGIGAFGKIEGLAFVPIMSFNLAITTSIRQNLGTREYERARKGARFGILGPMLTAETIGAVIFAVVPQLIAAFDRTSEVIRFGTDKTRTAALFFFLMAFFHAVASVLRGSGRSLLPMIVMVCSWCVCSWCVIRVVILAVGIPLIHSIQIISWSYPVTWLLSSAVFLILYRRMDQSN